MYLRSGDGFGQTPPAAAVPAEQPTFGIERAQRRSIDPAERWKLYREQSGPQRSPWDYFMTYAEYVSNLTNFTEIYRKRPKEYERAMQATLNFRKDWFGPYYRHLNDVARRSTLKSDSNGDLTLNYEKKSLIDLIGNAAAQQVLDELRDAGLTVTFGKRLGTRLAGLLGIVDTLNTLFKDARNLDLVRRCHRSADPVCFNSKLNLSMGILAGSGTLNRREHPASTKAYVIHHYFRYQKILRTYEHYVRLEEQLMGLPPLRPEPPKMGLPSQWARP